ncbi:transposase domain-containing protein [Streptomyces mutabilis]|nr:transposase domain-containing protein [Streptomyces mutabilis]MCZ9354771.1 transposase domain-containing protein [Streptomyces mutabilis]
MCPGSRVSRSLGALTRSCPPEPVDRVVDEVGRLEKRRRPLSVREGGRPMGRPPRSRRTCIPAAREERPGGQTRFVTRALASHHARWSRYQSTVCASAAPKARRGR